MQAQQKPKTQRYVPLQSPNKTRRLIEAVRKRRELYDSNTKDYTFKDKREKIWNEIAEELETVAGACKHRWLNLRTAYAKHLRTEKSTDKQTKSTRGGGGGYYLAKELEFIRKFMRPRDYVPSLPALKKPRIKVNPVITLSDDSCSSSTLTASESHFEIYEVSSDDEQIFEGFDSTWLSKDNYDVEQEPSVKLFFIPNKEKCEIEEDPNIQNLLITNEEKSDIEKEPLTKPILMSSKEKCDIEEELSVKPFRIRKCRVKISRINHNLLLLQQLESQHKTKINVNRIDTKQREQNCDRKSIPEKLHIIDSQTIAGTQIEKKHEHNVTSNLIKTPVIEHYETSHSFSSLEPSKQPEFRQEATTKRSHTNQDEIMIPTKRTKQDTISFLESNKILAKLLSTKQDENPRFNSSLTPSKKPYPEQDETLQSNPSLVGTKRTVTKQDDTSRLHSILTPSIVPVIKQEKPLDLEPPKTPVTKQNETSRTNASLPPSTIPIIKQEQPADLNISLEAPKKPIPSETSRSSLIPTKRPNSIQEGTARYDSSLIPPKRSFTKQDEIPRLDTGLNSKTLPVENQNEASNLNSSLIPTQTPKATKDDATVTFFKGVLPDIRKLSERGLRLFKQDILLILNRSLDDQETELR